MANVRTSTIVSNSTGNGGAGSQVAAAGGDGGEGGSSSSCCGGGSDGDDGSAGDPGANGSRGLGGVAKASGSLALSSSIIAGNSLQNCSGTISADNSNVAGDNTCNTNKVTADAVSTWLGPLANNGGPTNTMLPLPASRAIDAGNRVGNVGETDQRGKLRLGNGNIDAGAVEVMWNCLTTKDNGVTRYTSEDSAAVQYAADQSAAGGTIKISGACVGTQTRSSRQQLLSVEKKLVLQGGWNNTFATLNRDLYPTVLDAANTGRVLYVADNLIATVENLRLTRGSSADGGAAYLAAGTNVTLTYSLVYSNATTATGGGLYSLGSCADAQSEPHLLEHREHEWRRHLHEQWCAFLEQFQRPRESGYHFERWGHPKSGWVDLAPEHADLCQLSGCAWRRHPWGKQCDHYRDPRRDLSKHWTIRGRNPQ